LCGYVLVYAAQAIPPIDAEIAERVIYGREASIVRGHAPTVEAGRSRGSDEN